MNQKARLPKPPERVHPDDLANASLAGYIQWANTTKGAKARILRAIQARCTVPIQRPTVERWLHPDPTKRIYPRYGMGLLLLMVLEHEQTKAPETTETTEENGET